MAVSWIDLLSAAASGGIAVKVLDFLHTEYIRRKEASESTQAIVEKHLDPILKATDELVGKIRSFAQDDFKELLTNPESYSTSLGKNIPITSTVYLFGQLWARIQILRMESVELKQNNLVKYTNLGSVETHCMCLNFVGVSDPTPTVKIKQRFL